jgi:hypothetical protein
MPGSIVSELILRPVLEIVLYVFGYWTGRIAVPLLSLGQVRIEHADPEPGARTREDRKRGGPPKRVRPRWHGFQRAPDGAIVIDDEMTAYLGMLFWVAIATAAYFLFR